MTTEDHDNRKPSASEWLVFTLGLGSTPVRDAELLVAEHHAEVLHKAADALTLEAADKLTKGYGHLAYSGLMYAATLLRRMADEAAKS